MKKTNRKLSFAEEKRKERFEKTCEEMKKAGYEKHDLTVSILQANIIAIIIMLPFVMFFGYLYFRVNSTVDFVITGYSSIVLSGEPIDEPIVSHGPFVMNTVEEIYQAYEDFRNNKFGVENF